MSHSSRVDDLGARVVELFADAVFCPAALLISLQRLFELRADPA
jgi:hypothetical protein